MRQGPNKQRGRNNGGGRSPYSGGGNNNGGQRRSGVPNRNQNYDSSGPDVRIRGSAYQVYEKYLNLALDATSVGDRIMAESFYQHAEHYYRIINIIEYGPEDERRPNQQQNRSNNNQQIGHLYQPGFDGEGEDASGDHEDDGQAERPSYDRNAIPAQSNFDGQNAQQPEGNRYQQNPRQQNDRNQYDRGNRSNSNQRPDNRRSINEDASSDQAPDDGQQPVYAPRHIDQDRPQYQERAQRDYTQRYDNRSAVPQDGEVASETHGERSNQTIENEEGPQGLPDFIRRRGSRSAVRSASESQQQDEVSDQPE